MFYYLYLTENTIIEKEVFTVVTGSHKKKKKEEIFLSSFEHKSKFVSATKTLVLMYEWIRHLSLLGLFSLSHVCIDIKDLEIIFIFGH